MKVCLKITPLYWDLIPSRTAYWDGENRHEYAFLCFRLNCRRGEPKAP